ncbi:YegP family protein [Haloplanus litoreus]|uniref:YegP family protein n=1 Tax=Haloplanus litoreus TaxID=767515 RepID=A0ABD5ZXW2_9EURY
MAGATFQVFETETGSFRWRLRAADGTVLATSEDALPTKQAATRRLQRIKTVVPEAGVESI